MSVCTSVQKLFGLAQSVEEDARKCDGGNKAAGVRVRKVMQEIKALAQTIRKDVTAVGTEPKKKGKK